MTDDSQLPDLVFEDNHELLVLSAGVFMRFKSDEMAPPEWKEALADLRLDYWKELSKVRPNASGNRINTVDPTSGYTAPSQDRSSISSDFNS